MDDDVTTGCELLLLAGVVEARTLAGDASVSLITIDDEGMSITQNTVVVDAGDVDAYAVVYGFCFEDGSLDGCSYAISSNAAEVQTPAGDVWVFAFYGDMGGSRYACAFAYIAAACQSVPA